MSAYQTLCYNKVIAKNVSTQILPKNEARVALEIFPPGGVTGAMSPGVAATVAAGAQVGIAFGTNATVRYRFDIEDHGDIVTADWSFMSGSACDLSYLEVVKVKG